VSEQSYLVVEVSGALTVDQHRALVAVSDPKLVEIGLGTGFGAERVLKFFASVSKPALAQLKALAQRLTDAHRVTGVKISRDGVEIGSMHADDVQKIEQFIIRTLDRLDAD